MFAQLQHKTRSIAGVAALLAALATLVFSASAGASNKVRTEMLVPAAVRTPAGVTNAAKPKRKHPTKPGMGWYGTKGMQFNPMYTYSQIDIGEKGDGNSGGSFPTDTVKNGVLYHGALNIAMTQGNDTLVHYSHDTNDFKDVPNPAERTSAAGFKISGFQTLFSTSSGAGAAGAEMIKVQLAAGKPVAIGMNLRPGFWMWNKTAEAAIDSDTTGVVRALTRSSQPATTRVASGSRTRGAIPTGTEATHACPGPSCRRMSSRRTRSPASSRIRPRRRPRLPTPPRTTRRRR